MGRYININDNTSIRTEFTSGEDFTTITPQADTYFIGVDPLTGSFKKLNPDGSIIDLEAGSINVTTYADLVSAIGSNSLIPGNYYEISDFETILDVPDFNLDDSVKSNLSTNFGPNYPIVVLATSTNSIDSKAYSLSDARYQIKYDVTFDKTEIMAVSAKGRITEMIDNDNNRTHYDHLNMFFKRYQVYEKNLGAQTGFIGEYNSTTGYIYGVPGTTLFNTEITSGDILLLDTKKELGYEIGVKVVGVIDDETLTVAVDPDFSGVVDFSGKNYVFYKASSYGNYKSYKEVYVTQSIDNDYSYYSTFDINSSKNYMGGDLDFDLGIYPFRSSNNIIGSSTDNRIESGHDNTIGNHFDYNEIGYSFNKNLVGSGFKYNKIKSDCSYNTFNDYFDYNEIGNFCVGNIFYDYFSLNVVGDFCGKGPAGNPNIFGAQTKRNKIGHYFGQDTGGNPQGNKMGIFTKLSYKNVHAPVVSLNITNPGTGYVDASGVATTTTGTGSNLTVNITTSAGAVISVSVNNPGEYYGTGTGETITVTGGGGDCTLEVTTLDPFASSTSIDNGTGGTAEFTNNSTSMTGENGDMYLKVIIGDLIPNDIIDDNVNTYATISDILISSSPPTPTVTSGPKDNVIGNYFINNTIGIGFDRNKIGDYFGNDQSTGLSNIILDNFQDNVIGSYFGIDVQTPDTGNGGNLIRSNFIGNTVGTDFTYNTTFDTGGGGYYNNTIGFGCNNNIFGDSFNYNKLGDLFQSNTIDTNFGGNIIGYFFNVNSIGSNFADNVIGDVSWFNTFGPNCQSNKANSMFGNDIGIDFSGNIIAENFGLFFTAGNTIANACYDNTFGNFFVDNNVNSGMQRNIFGSYCNSNGIEIDFTDNVCGNFFQGNTIASGCFNNNFNNYFQGNTLNTGFNYVTFQSPMGTGLDFTLATHVYAGYSCNILIGTGGLPNYYLSYYDSGLGSMQYVSPTA